MEKIFLLSLLVLAVAVAMLSVGILFRGRFSNSHVSGNRYLRQKGIHCARQQRHALPTLMLSAKGRSGNHDIQKLFFASGNKTLFI